MCIGITERHPYNKQNFANPVMFGLTPLDDAADKMVLHLTDDSKSRLADALADHYGVPPGRYHGLLVMVDRDELVEGRPVYRHDHDHTLGVIQVDNLDRRLVLAVYGDWNLREEVRKALFNHCNSRYGEVVVQLH